MIEYGGRDVGCGDGRDAPFSALDAVELVAGGPFDSEHRGVVFQGGVEETAFVTGCGRNDGTKGV